MCFVLFPSCGPRHLLPLLCPMYIAMTSQTVEQDWSSFDQHHDLFASLAGDFLWVVRNIHGVDRLSLQGEVESPLEPFRP